MTKKGFVTVFTQDISQEIPEEMKQADCIYCKPPCSYIILTGYYHRAGQAIPPMFDAYGAYIKRFFEYIDEISPKHMYLEVTANNKDIFIDECKKRFNFVNVDEAYYNRNRKFKCWIIRCGRTDAAPSPSKTVEVNTYIRWICKNTDFKCIADPVMQSAAVGFYSHKNERKFIGTELNKKRLAILLQRIDEYDAKEAKKERKRLAKHNKQP